MSLLKKQLRQVSRGNEHNQSIWKAEMTGGKVFMSLELRFLLSVEMTFHVSLKTSIRKQRKEKNISSSPSLWSLEIFSFICPEIFSGESQKRVEM